MGCRRDVTTGLAERVPAALPGLGPVGRRGGRGRVSGPAVGLRARSPGRALRKGGGSPCGWGAQMCAAEGQVRGRAEVGGNSGAGNPLGSCRAQARVSSARPSGAPAGWELWGARPRASRAQAAFRPRAVGWAATAAEPRLWTRKGGARKQKPGLGYGEGGGGRSPPFLPQPLRPHAPFSS